MTTNSPAAATESRHSASEQSDARRTPTYRQIVKSSGVIGAASLAGIALGIVRTKAIALILGPTGIGLMGLYGSIADVVQSVAGMGVSSSGVRQIAEAAGSGEEERIARTATALKWIAPLLGLMGALTLLLFSRRISLLTFGTKHHTQAVALLSLAVLFTTIAGGQAALVQGMRRIGDLARMSVLGAIGGTAFSIPLVYFFGEKGIVPTLICVAATTIATSWWFSRRIKIPRITLRWRELKRETFGLLRLGAAFMASGFLALGGAYAIRIIIVHKIGLEAAGFYQSAWAIGGLYVGIVLQAMGADFYPRLTAIAKDHHECNRLVNEQAHISLLLAGPGVIGTLTFAPVVIALCYSTKFGAAVENLRWICLGMTLRIIAWPMGFILLAKGASTLFFLTDVAATAVHMSLAWLLIAKFGLNGAGTAFFGLYIWHALLIYTIVRRLTGFRWSAENLRLAAMFLPLVTLVFLQFYWLPFWLATGIGATALLISGYYSARVVLSLVAMKHPQ